MNRLKLSAVEDHTPVKLTIEFPAQVHRDLVAYGQAMAGEPGGKAHEPVQLVASMVAMFMASDRGFVRKPRAPAKGQGR
jgi:hypothetical protein